MGMRRLIVPALLMAAIACSPAPPNGSSTRRADSAASPPATSQDSTKHFDAKGKPKDWPLRFSVIRWSVTLKGMEAGAYEFRVRSVDLNGFAQPEPRPYPKSGRNEIQYRPIMVMA